jgi:cytochrome c oxidase subunit IV
MATIPQTGEVHPGAQVPEHGPSLGLLAGILVALLGLTFITVAVTWYAWTDFGSLNIWIALLIATTKAALVVLYFMHLRYDKPFNGVVLIAALFFVALFIGIALQDSLNYRSSHDETWQSVNAPDIKQE